MKPAQTPTPAAVSDILLYLANLIVEKQGNTKIRGDIEKIMNIQNMDILDQNAAAEEIFGRFEKILSEYFVLEKIKEDIREKFDLAEIRLPFINKFLPGNERGLRELEEKASIISGKLLPLIGRADLEKFIRENTSSNLLKGTALSGNGSLDFSVVEQRLFKLPPPWFKLGAKMLDKLVFGLKLLLDNEAKIKIN